MATSRAGGASDGATLAASQRHLLARAAAVGLLMRHTVNLGVAIIGLADPASLALPDGVGILALLAMWSLYRALSFANGPTWLAGDYLFVLVVCLAIPALVPDPGFYLSNTVPQAIAGTAVVSFSVSVPARVSLGLTVGIAAAYAVGAARVSGPEQLQSITALYYFAVQWATAAAIRGMLLGVASAIDRARGDRQEAELAQQVTDAVRNYEREQLALLHDTAASTLLMVGQGTSVSADRLAAQARRDLALLRAGAWTSPPARMELVAALRDCAQHLRTPVIFRGRESLWLSGENAQPVIAAAREAMNNIDRHANASSACVTVLDDAIRLEDDGVGFDVDTLRSGHGVTDSIIGRMRRCGGQARVTSAPGSGTVTELRWAGSYAAGTQARETDSDRLVERTRTRYGLAITVYALVNLAITAPPAIASAGNMALQTGLAISAALGVLVAIPGVLYGRWGFAPWAVLLLLVVAVCQPAALPPDLLLGYAHWAQGGVGWCVVPLALALPTRVGAGILIAFWIIGSAIVVVRDPSAEALVNIGLGTASILGVQLFALIFNGLMRDAAVAVDSEARAYEVLMKRDRVAQALHDEYQRRYASIVDNVVPLLDTLTCCGQLDTAVQQRARAEWHRLRALFDQASVFDHCLMQSIRPLIDGAEARHVDVVVDVSGAVPNMEESEIASLAAPIGEVLSRARSRARIVLVAKADTVEVSVVIDIPPDVDAQSLRLAGTDVVVSGEELWCLIPWSARPSRAPGYDETGRRHNVSGHQ